MTPGSILNALKGISGEFELIRTMGAFGLFCYVVGALVFQGWAMSRGDHFDIVAFCAAFPGGLALAYGSIAGAAAIKDRNVAVAQVVRDTGSQPGSAASADPTSVTVVNKPDDPIPVQENTP
jgi:hypothetical protein